MPRRGLRLQEHMTWTRWITGDTREVISPLQLWEAERTALSWTCGIVNRYPVDLTNIDRLWPSAYGVCDLPPLSGSLLHVDDVTTVI
jgi:hypothetical protein